MFGKIIGFLGKIWARLSAAAKKRAQARKDKRLGAIKDFKGGQVLGAERELEDEKYFEKNNQPQKKRFAK